MGPRKFDDDWDLDDPKDLPGAGDGFDDRRYRGKKKRRAKKKTPATKRERRRLAPDGTSCESHE